MGARKSLCAVGCIVGVPPAGSTVLVGNEEQTVLVRLVAIAGLGAIILAFYIGAARSSTASKSVSGLQPGKTYLWKVIAEDDKGGSVESETRRFTMR